MEELGRACTLISCCLRCPDSRPWCSEHCCSPAFCTVVLERIDRWGPGEILKTFSFVKVKVAGKPLHVLGAVSFWGWGCGQVVLQDEGWSSKASSRPVCIAFTRLRCWGFLRQAQSQHQLQPPLRASVGDRGWERQLCSLSLRAWEESIPSFLGQLRPV